MLDFGSGIQYNKLFCDNYYRIIDGARKSNYEEVIELSKQIGFLNGDESQEYKNTHYDTIRHIAEPFVQNQPYDFSKQDITSKVYQTLPKIVKGRLKQPPLEVYTLH